MCKENMPKTLVEGTNNFFINFSAALEYYVYKPYACIKVVMVASRFKAGSTITTSIKFRLEKDSNPWPRYTRYTGAML